MDSALGCNVRGPEFQLALVVGSVGLYVQQLDGSSGWCTRSGSTSSGQWLPCNGIGVEDSIPASSNLGFFSHMSGGKENIFDENLSL